MCRFALYSGPGISLSSLVTEPTHSLIHQSFHALDRDKPLNGDGFGVAWYVPELADVAVFKDITPAWSNMNLLHLARATRSSCIMAHVRAATPGSPVHHLNCHPFYHGPFAFMHNGYIAGFRKMRRHLLEKLSQESFDLIQGSTDSEHIFALFIDHFHHFQAQEDHLPRLQAIRAALHATIIDIETLMKIYAIKEPSPLNLAVADGSSAVVSRYVTPGEMHANSLYIHKGSRYICEKGICQMVEAEHGEGAVIIASEPLSDDSGWKKVPQNSFVTVDERRHVEVLPCIAGSAKG